MNSRNVFFSVALLSAIGLSACGKNDNSGQILNQANFGNFDPAYTRCGTIRSTATGMNNGYYGTGYGTGYYGYGTGYYGYGNNGYNNNTMMAGSTLTLVDSSSNQVVYLSPENQTAYQRLVSELGGGQRQGCVQSSTPQTNNGYTNSTFSFNTYQLQ